MVTNGECLLGYDGIPECYFTLLHNERHVPELSLDESYLEESVSQTFKKSAEEITLLYEKTDYFFCLGDMEMFMDSRTKVNELMPH